MLNINTKKGKKQFQQHPRVKIYYLRNDSPNKKENEKNVAPVVGPSLFCLSSMIQHEKKGLGIQGDEFEPFHIDEATQNQQQQPQKVYPHTTFVKFPAQHNPQPSHRNSKTVQAKPQTQLQSLYPQSKRFIKTSQQNYFARKHENNESLAKDFLCNIVKEWNVEESNNEIKKGILSKRRKSMHHKTFYTQEELTELRKNKSLMKQHFDLFLQNQQKKAIKPKEKSLTLLQAVFQREDSSNSIHDKRIEQIQLSQALAYAKQAHSSKLASRLRGQRRHSLTQKPSQDKSKKDYMRLLYGPQVKLVPRLFQDRSRNFDWMRLDKKNYHSKTKQSINHE